MAATPSSGSTTSPLPERMSVRSASATTSSASSRRRKRSVRQSFGGPSPERKVSVASAQHVASVLEEAEAWFWAVEGGIHRVDRVALLAHEKPFETEFVPRSKASFASLEAALDDPGSRKAVFFLALHGTGGEDGTAQQMFEDRRIAFTGPGAEASRKAMDKEWAKKLVSAAGVRVAEAIRLPRGDAKTAREALLPFLAGEGADVVKPVASGY